MNSRTKQKYNSQGQFANSYKLMSSPNHQSSRQSKPLDQAETSLRDGATVSLTLKLIFWSAFTSGLGVSVILVAAGVKFAPPFDLLPWFIFVYLITLLFIGILYLFLHFLHWHLDWADTRNPYFSEKKAIEDDSEKSSNNNQVIESGSTKATSIKNAQLSLQTQTNTVYSQPPRLQVNSKMDLFLVGRKQGEEDLTTWDIVNRREQRLNAAEIEVGNGEKLLGVKFYGDAQTGKEA